MNPPTKNPLPPGQVGMFVLVVGVLCLIAALIFGAIQTTRTTVPGHQSPGEAPNITSAGAACGFAIAGGLCSIPAAITVSAGQGPGPSRQPNAEPAAAAGRPRELGSTEVPATSA